MIINDKEILNTLVTGKFQGLDLATPLYLGGHPKVSDLGYGQGFIGCISQLKINGDDIDITPKNGVLGIYDLKSSERSGTRNMGFGFWKCPIEKWVFKAKNEEKPYSTCIQYICSMTLHKTKKRNLVCW